MFVQWFDADEERASVLYFSDICLKMFRISELLTGMILDPAPLLPTSYEYPCLEDARMSYGQLSFMTKRAI